MNHSHVTYRPHRLRRLLPGISAIGAGVDQRARIAHCQQLLAVAIVTDIRDVRHGRANHHVLPGIAAILAAERANSSEYPVSIIRLDSNLRNGSAELRYLRRVPRIAG